MGRFTLNVFILVVSDLVGFMLVAVFVTAASSSVVGTFIPIPTINVCSSIKILDIPPVSSPHSCPGVLCSVQPLAPGPLHLSLWPLPWALPCCPLVPGLGQLVNIKTHCVWESAAPPNTVEVRTGPLLPMLSLFMLHQIIFTCHHHSTIKALDITWSLVVDCTLVCVFSRNNFLADGLQTMLPHYMTYQLTLYWESVVTFLADVDSGVIVNNMIQIAIFIVGFIFTACAFQYHLLFSCVFPHVNP